LRLEKTIFGLKGNDLLFKQRQCVVEIASLDKNNIFQYLETRFAGLKNVMSPFMGFFGNVMSPFMGFFGNVMSPFMG